MDEAREKLTAEEQAFIGAARVEFEAAGFSLIEPLYSQGGIILTDVTKAGLKMPLAVSCLEIRYHRGIPDLLIKLLVDMAKEHHRRYEAGTDG